MEIFAISKRFISIVKNLESKGLVKSKTQLAEKLGTHKQSLTEILNGKRNVTLELTSKICEHFYANPSYLLLGHSPLFVNPDSETKKNISYVPIKAHAGYGDQIDNPVFEEDLEKFGIPGMSFEDSEYRCFEVEGDSMLPSYNAGDSVICSAIAPVYFEQMIRNNKVYVVVTKDSIFIKRLLNNIKEEGKITMLSDNEAYMPVDMPIAEILEIWLVDGLITKSLPK